MSTQGADAGGELGAVVATGTLHLIFENLLDAKVAFLAAAVPLWLGYLILRIRRSPRILAEWGFSRKNLAPASLAAGAVTAAGAAGLAAIGALQSTLSWNFHLFLLLLLYPVWGLAQQFLLQALVARNLLTLTDSRAASIALASILFGAVHLPDLPLAGATALLACVLTPIYLRLRNLWPLGFAHGWLGTLAYFWLLGRDPFAPLTPGG